MKHIALALPAFLVLACSARAPSVEPDADGGAPTRSTDYLCGPVFARATFAADRMTLDVDATVIADFGEEGRPPG